MTKVEESRLSLIGCTDTSTSTYTVGAEPTSISVDAMFKALEKIEEITAEADAPFRKWMVEQGCDPMDGYVLWLPWHMRDEIGIVPYFVLFGKGITTPMITKDFRLNPYNFKFTNY